ncbi:MAG: hypothetical protein KatS3mg114_0595 [Planctomycetaceae bacterium]|nr:MAG: hypothetical protein KatS3mg114_0595 [Planctomycetaceae bacterium]
MTQETSSESTSPQTVPVVQPLTFSRALQRAVALRCPQCGQGPLFRSWFSMHDRCSACGCVFERAPGFYLGSTYVNYGFTCLTLTAWYIWLHYSWGWSNKALTPWLLAWCVVVPILLFRYARAWWLAMDCFFDRDATSGLTEGEHEAEGADRPLHS